MSRYLNQTTYLLTGIILGETDKAIKFRVDEINGSPYVREDTEKNVAPVQWFPISQVTNTLKNSRVGPDEIRISEWILSQKGMI